MKKKIVTFLCTIGMTLIAIPSIAMAQGMPPTLVVTDTVLSMDFHEQITLIGRTEAKIESRIVAEISGRVAAIDAAEGNRIRKGETLVSIDSERMRLLLAAKEAEVVEGRVQTELARSQWDRVVELYDQKLVREISRDSARAWLAIAEVRHLKLTAERDRLALDLANCRIKAPYSGYTLRRLIDVGEWVKPGTEVFEMVDLTTVTVVVDLPERHFGRVAIGSSVRIVISGDDQSAVTGTVTGFAPRAVAETHAFPVIVSVDNQEGRLGGGALVKATLSLDETFTSLAVSKDAIVRQGPQTMVYTINDGKAAPISVRITSKQGDMAAISGEGLVSGMTVVVRGNERIFPGSPVRIAGAEPAGGPPGSEPPAGEQEGSP